MKLIIDIPEEEYDKIKDSAKHNAMYLDRYLLMQRAITDGIALPKGHGRLIDADELKKIIKENDALTMTGFSVRLCDINNAPTIIEADK